MREEARSSLRSKRRLWKALNLVGDDVPHADLVELVVEHLAEVEARTAWELVEVERRGSLLEPTRAVESSDRSEGWWLRRGELVNAVSGEVW